jgi:hypothetical protein
MEYSVLIVTIVLSLSPPYVAATSIGFAPNATGGGKLNNNFHPPIYNITATSMYDAGRQHGVLAGDRIRRWFAGDEIQALVAFVKHGKGKHAYENLRRDSTEAFPLYTEELRGIADGAECSLDLVWTGILMIELQNLLNGGHAREEHCTDIAAIATGGYADGFAHGHNEDWSKEVGNLYYYIKYTAAPGADFASCAGLAYPGALIGWAPTWNAHGMFMTVNTLVPYSIKPYGISTSFIQRDAICGVGKGRDLSAVAAGLSDPRWSCGASLNLVDTAGRGMGNVETYLDTHDVEIVTEGMGNASHFNVYKRLPVEEDKGGSSVERQAMADSMPAPRSVDDIKTILSSDTILRLSTIGTLLLDGTGRMQVWGGAAPATTSPLYTWDLGSFFDFDDQR